MIFVSNLFVVGAVTFGSAAATHHLLNGDLAVGFISLASVACIFAAVIVKPRDS